MLPVCHWLLVFFTRGIHVDRVLFDWNWNWNWNSMLSLLRRSYHFLVYPKYPLRNWIISCLFIFKLQLLAHIRLWLIAFIGINFIDTYELIFVFFFVFFLIDHHPIHFTVYFLCLDKCLLWHVMNFMLLDILLFFFGYIFKVCVHMNLSSKMGPSLLLLLLLLLLNIKMDPCELWLKSPENLCLILSVVLFFFLMKNTSLEIWQFVLGFY